LLSESIAMLTRSTGYALQALTFLAKQRPGRLVGAGVIARATQVPKPFLWKVLRQLGRDGLIRSCKGVHGGYELACPANQITLVAVVELIQRENPATTCILGGVNCDANHACLLQHACACMRASFQAAFGQLTIADLEGAKRRKAH